MTTRPLDAGGYTAGTARDALDCACGLYLNLNLNLNRLAARLTTPDELPARTT